MLLLYFFLGGRGVFVFMQPVVPPLVIVLLLFCIKQKFSYFCIFFSCGKLDCIFFVPSICSCIGYKGGERAVIAVRVSSFHFFFFPIRKKKAKEGTKGWGCLPLASLLFLIFVLFL